MSENVTPDRIMQTGFGFFASKALLSAVELDLFTELAEEPLTLEELEDRLNLHPRSSKDFLDALVALGFLDREDGRYRNAPDADAFLDRNKESYMGGMLEMANERLYHFWGDLTEALQTGEPTNEMEDTETHPFEAIYQDEETLETFTAAMTGLSSGSAQAIAEKFPWDEYDSMCDIGTSEGIVPVTLAQEYDHLDVAGFDLPKVKPIFEEFVNEKGIADRAEFHAGDFFEDPLPEADVLVFGHILHDWGLETKQMLLEKAYEAVPEGGTVIVYGSLIDNERRKNEMALLMSLNMLIESPDGFDYTWEECQQWMKDAGFKSTRVEQLPGPESMVIAEK